MRVCGCNMWKGMAALMLLGTHPQVAICAGDPRTLATQAYMANV